MNPALLQSLALRVTFALSEMVESFAIRGYLFHSTYKLEQLIMGKSILLVDMV